MKDDFKELADFTELSLLHGHFKGSESVTDTKTVIQFISRKTVNNWTLWVNHINFVLFSFLIQ